MSWLMRRMSLIAQSLGGGSVEQLSTVTTMRVARIWDESAVADQPSGVALLRVNRS